MRPVPVLLEIASSVTFWISFAFLPAISLIWPWWRGDWGRNIIALETCIWVSLLPAPLHALFGVPYGTFLSWFQVLAVFGAGAVVIWRAIMIWQAQRHGDRDGA